MAVDSGGNEQSHKSHRAHKSGASAKKKNENFDKKDQDATAAKKRNPKAFAFNSSVKAKRLQSRTSEIEQRKLHMPVIDRSTGEPAPLVVVVHGPPQVGKSLLIKCLVKHYTKQNLSEVRGPITVVSGKQRRVQFLECPNDINGMIDAAKIADLALLLIDGSYGFEMETFEFLNIMQVHGFPKVMGVLTHLDKFKDVKKLRKTKQRLKHRFWTEIKEGAKLFYLSGLISGKYPKREIHNLARFISVIKTVPLSWRMSHPYLLVDRFEDVTPPGRLHMNSKCDRNITLYGYLRGCNMKRGTKVHVTGAGDFNLAGLTSLADPCPLPSAAKKKGLRDKEKLFYAPMSGIGELLYDKDAVYININDHLVQFSKVDDGSSMAAIKGNDHDVGEVLVKSLQNTRYSIDEKLENSFINLFSRKPLASLRDIGDEKDSESKGYKKDGMQSQVGKDKEILGSSDPRYGTEVLEHEALERDLIKDDDDDDDSDDDDDEGGSDVAAEDKHEEDMLQNPYNYDLQEEVQFQNGRVRRKAISSNFGAHADMEDSDEDDRDDRSSGSECSEGSGDSEDEADNASKWKESLISRTLMKKNDNLMQIVYGQLTSKSPTAAREGHDTSESDESEGEEFFKPKGQKEKVVNEKSGCDDNDAEDCSKFFKTELRDWSNEELIRSIRDRFVTGNWSKAAQRSQATNDDIEDGTVYGDFEDLETGEVYMGKQGDNSDANGDTHKGDDQEMEERRLKKLALRAKFDAQYNGSEQSEEEDNQANEKNSHRDKNHDIGYFDKLKEEIELRKQMNISELNDLDEDTRVEVEGFRTGTYIRLEVHDVPFEMVEHFDPHHPLLVGGIGLGEENDGYMQASIKRHRWHKKVLKTRDPIIVSVGWRRFQTIPVYAIEDRNGRHRMLKYTPEHMYCFAMFWGPLAPPKSGVLAVQKLSNNQKRSHILLREISAPTEFLICNKFSIFQYIFHIFVEYDTLTCICSILAVFFCLLLVFEVLKRTCGMCCNLFYR
ncbi:uncharacterized protein [Typha angustifolia]|uniref:uncharacterized protein isoform X2 n=1 Tax=Typha angustifolia TaxID=59011 RepID=UPI003C2BA880